MNRRVLWIVSLACAAVLLWVLLARETGESAADSTSIPAVEPPAIAPAAAEESRPNIQESSPVGDRELAALPEPSKPEGSPPTVPPLPVDKKARDWIHLIVQDRLGAPVANAEITMVGLRTKRDPGSHYGWPVEESLGRTAADGTVKLWFPVWVNPDDEAGQLTFQVVHPDFVTKTVDGFEVGPEPRVVVLERGAFVVVSGWIESPSQVIADVVPHLTWEVKLAGDSWQPIQDGRLSTANIPPGPHAIYLSHSNQEGEQLFSEVTDFTLEPDEQEVLHLRLLPAAKLEGVLEEEVPRPVRNGNVLVNLQVDSLHEDARGGERVTMLRKFTAPIRSDGSFTVSGLPPGDGQIIALCDGWASERVVDEDGPEEGAAPMERETVIRSKGSRALIPQRVDPARGERFVLRMEATANLKAIVRGPDGKPVDDAKVSCWPNVFWSSGYSSMFMDGEWSATSDVNGELVVSNIPWGRMPYGLSHETLELPIEEGRRTRQVELEPGRTTEVALELVPKED